MPESKFFDAPGMMNQGNRMNAAGIDSFPFKAEVSTH
jgi:hypothetical protein